MQFAHSVEVILRAMRLPCEQFPPRARRVHGGGDAAVVHQLLVEREQHACHVGAVLGKFRGQVDEVDFAFGATYAYKTQKTFPQIGTGAGGIGRTACA